jgi:quercetin dioxygenase-like cupin family protein
MKLVKMSQIPKEPFPNPIFTGSDVARQMLVPDSKNFNVTLANVGKGVRNKLHTHDSEQILIVTAGDIILFSAGEKHWHARNG